MNIQAVMEQQKLGSLRTAELEKKMAGIISSNNITVDKRRKSVIKYK